MDPVEALPSPSDSPSALEYRAAAAGPRRRLFSWPVFIVATCLVLLIFGVFGVVFPRLEAIYREYGVLLPRPTQFVLDVARFMRRGLLLSASLPLVLGFLVPFALARRLRSPMTRAQWWIVALTIAVIVLTAALALVIVVWVLPMYRLFTGFFR